MVGRFDSSRIPVTVNETCLRYYYYRSPYGGERPSTAYINSTSEDSNRDRLDDLVRVVAVVTYLDTLPVESDAGEEDATLQNVPDTDIIALDSPKQSWHYWHS